MSSILTNSSPSPSMSEYLVTRSSHNPKKIRLSRGNPSMFGDGAGAPSVTVVAPFFHSSGRIFGDPEICTAWTRRGHQRGCTVLRCPSLFSFFQKKEKKYQNEKIPDQFLNRFPLSFSSLKLFPHKFLPHTIFSLSPFSLFSLISTLPTIKSPQISIVALLLIIFHQFHHTKQDPPLL